MSDIDTPLTGEPAVLPSGQVLNIHNCPACDGKHDGISVKDFNRPQPPFTHWYQCPTLGDPIFLSLAAAKAGDRTAFELNSPVIQALAAGQAAGRWLAAIWFVRDGRLEMRVHQDRMPVSEYFGVDGDTDRPGCLVMLKDAFEKMAGSPAPLPEREMRHAETPFPLRDLMGNGSAQPKKQTIKLPPGTVLESPEA